MTGRDYQPIEDYGIIGDLHTAALVARDGSIDFCCLPRFDSPTVFAALLDRAKGGRFGLGPRIGDDTTCKQIYLPDTNVLITRFLADGVSEVSDFMPIPADGADATAAPRTIVRRCKAVRGVVRFELLVDPRFDYARAAHKVEQRDGEVLFVSSGADQTALRLRTPVPVTIDRRGAAVATFDLHAGEKAAFVLEEAHPGAPSPSAAPDFVPTAFTDTVNFWRTWIGRSNYAGRWREVVNRSALVLKLLVSGAHGSLVASPTFGLPERIGGVRNWDYRYTWIRDSSFALHALILLGYTDEMRSFMRWIHERCMDLDADGSLQVIYGHDGRKVLTEEVLEHLEGYRGSAPVRIGNAAYDQLQLDIYGELIDAVDLFDQHGEPIPHALWTNIVRLVDYVTEHWQQPDEGIWEVRGGRQEFLYSRLQCWVAVDRAIRLGERRSFPYPFARWRATRDEIYHDIMANFWDARRHTFVQCKGSEVVDASSLVMPMVKFVSFTDPRFVSTLRALTETLVEDSLVYRYRLSDGASDGLPGDEGTFNMCSFWFAEAVARAGDVQRGRFFFEKMLGYANHVGLYAEELGPQGEHLGNYPQAFTHLGLVSAAYAIDRKLSDAGWAG